jgi:hypothetical protein
MLSQGCLCIDIAYNTADFTSRGLDNPEQIKRDELCANLDTRQYRSGTRGISHRTKSHITLKLRKEIKQFNAYLHY